MRSSGRVLVMVLAALVGQQPAASAQEEQRPGSTPTAKVAGCEHGIDRARCPFCTPSLVESDGFCGGHDVPEALCVKCRPFLKTAFVAKGDWCAEHATPESQCAICRGGAAEIGAAPRYQQPPSTVCAKTSTTLTLTSPAVVRAAGFEFEEVRPRDLRREIERNAEIVYDANQYARLAARAPGVIVEVKRDLGDPVQVGDIVAVVDSIAIGSAKADLLQASELEDLWQANADREQLLMEKGAGTERAVLEARTRLAEARITVSRTRQKLRNLGMTEQDLERIVEHGDTASLLPVTAPFAGTVVERAAVVGEVVDEHDLIFAIADTGRMWAMIDLREEDLATVRTGQPVVFRSDGLSGRVFPGTLTWISTQLDRKTRTVQARAEFDNPGQWLRAFMFGRATVMASGATRAVTVPKSAVQWEGCCNIAFVKENDEGTVFRPARLELGFDAGDHYEVLSGLAEGELVVTAGSYILKNELLKDAMGAGCCEVDHLAK